MNIAIIGAGWFGCHLAATLKNNHTVTIFEKEKEIFQSASGYNQYRLHYGLHYPRSRVTRDQIVQTSNRFLQNYENFVEPIENNLYAIANDHSLIDFGTYLSILRQENISFEEVEGKEFGLRNIEGTVRCEEKSINTSLAKKYFQAVLGNNIRFNTPVTKLTSDNNHVFVDGEKFDYAINCTYNRFHPITKLKVFYETDLVLTYKNNDCKTALTVMDGPFASFYPFQDVKHPLEQFFTLTSVKHTPTKKFKDFSTAHHFLQTLDWKFAAQKRPLFEKVISKYYPTFTKEFTYVGFFKAIKTKLYNPTSSRELIITHNNRISDILSGKISHIFLAEDAIKEQIKKLS